MKTLVQPPLIRAPFPWFGGKALAADLIWQHFGSDIKNYVEPFFGSGAVLLNAPNPGSFKSVVNDIDGYVCNFWRAVAADAPTVAFYANSQVNEIDLQARHQWLVDQRQDLTEKLKQDPNYYCAQSAGWWAWGCCCWIGSNWCSEVTTKTKLGNPVKKVGQSLPHLGNGGRGVNRKLPDLDGNNLLETNRHQARLEFLTDWMGLLNNRMRDTRITCGDWQRICSIGTLTAFGRCAILLDPPYGTTTKVYAKDSNAVAIEVREWCIQNGHNPVLKIALCGHMGQHEELEEIGWVVESPKVHGGYQGGEDRERIWFSPGCNSAANPIQASIF